MTNTFIIALAAEAYAGVLLIGFRREAAGLLLHSLNGCNCPSWKRCERLHKSAG